MISIFEKKILPQNLPFGRVQFAMAIAKPTLWKGTICNGHRNTYPLEGYYLPPLPQNLPFQRVPFATAVAKPILPKGTTPINKNIPELLLR
jgi:hypothetical protein